MKPKKDNSIKIMIFMTIFAFCLIGFALYLIVNYEDHGYSEGEVFVSNIIDGDTFEMSDGEIVRLLCVDTPEEGEKGFDEADSFLGSLVLHEIVRLEAGELSDDVDKYNRSLRWVYVNVSDEEIFVNKEVIRLGFGDVLELVEGACGGI